MIYATFNCADRDYTPDIDQTLIEILNSLKSKE